MRVSVEISTFNNAPLVRRVLEHLARQTYPADLFEVVISDDGSTDRVVDMVRSLAPELAFAVTLLENEHRGAGHAHNRGIRACKNDLVVMLAADVLATPTLIEDHVRLQREHPAPQEVVVGRLLQSPELPGDAIQQGWNRVVNRLFERPKDDIQHGGFLVSNISFKRDFMLRHGMFREWPPVAQEDMELGYRLRQVGMRVIRSPGALGYHHHEVTLAGLARRAYMQGYNYHYLEDNVPEAWIRRKTGRVAPADGLGPWLAARLKGALRRAVVNEVTLRGVVYPLLHSAERRALLRPLVPSLCGKVTLHHFHAGLRDRARGREFDLSRVVPG